MQKYFRSVGKPFDARASSFANRTSISIKQVIYGVYTIQPGDFRVKRRRGGNHVDVFESDHTLIGGNVNDAVTRRSYSPASLLRDGTTSVTPFYDGPHRSYRSSVVKLVQTPESES